MIATDQLAGGSSDPLRTSLPLALQEVHTLLADETVTPQQNSSKNEFVNPLPPQRKQLQSKQWFLTFPKTEVSKEAALQRILAKKGLLLSD